MGIRGWKDPDEKILAGMKVEGQSIRFQLDSGERSMEHKWSLLGNVSLIW